MVKNLQLFFFLCCFSGLITESLNAQEQKYVILKLDDVVAGSNGEVVSSRWQRVADYLESKKIKSAFGIIGYSLNGENPAYFNWIKDHATKGWIEFWNHGYRERTEKDTIGEFVLSYEIQLRSLQLTDSLAKEKLGIALTAWGPHWSGTNTDTDRALSQISGIRMTFGRPDPAIYYKGFVFPTNMEMEFPVHNPDFKTFQDVYYGKWKDLKYFYLQGHPNSWNDVRWENFVQVIEFLESENVRFVTPVEFLKIVEENQIIP